MILTTQEYRDVIRGSWGRPAIPAVTTRLAFMLGLPSQPGLQSSLDRENQQHQADWVSLSGTTSALTTLQT